MGSDRQEIPYDGDLTPKSERFKSKPAIHHCMPVRQTKCPKCRHYLESQHKQAWREKAMPVEVPRPPLLPGYQCLRCSCFYFTKPKDEDGFVV